MAYGMMRFMEKTTVYLDPGNQRRLRALARRLDRPQAELIREAIDEYLGRRAGFPLPSWVGIVSTDSLDSTKIGEYRREYREYLDRKHGGAGG